MSEVRVKDGESGFLILLKKRHSLFFQGVRAAARWGCYERR